MMVSDLCRVVIALAVETIEVNMPPIRIKPPPEIRCTWIRTSGRGHARCRKDRNSPVAAAVRSNPYNRPAPARRELRRGAGRCETAEALAPSRALLSAQAISRDAGHSPNLAATAGRLRGAEAHRLWPGEPMNPWRP